MEKLLRRLRYELEKLQSLIYTFIFYKKSEKGIVEGFHKLYYTMSNRTADLFWLGIPIAKCPLDLWIFQEIIFEVKPDVIIECGTSYGGGALFLASLCDMISNGRIITIDIESKEGRPEHKRITYMLGSSTSTEIVENVRSLIEDKDRVMVVLNSDHSKEHVLKELRIYSKLVTKGSYLIVEDTNINGHPVYPGFGPGPMEAVEEFLKENKDFVTDRNREKLYLTYNPKGYLRRIK
jgi:cephalosporin hydroxylase